MHELAALIKYDRDFSRTNLICLTETWLNKDVINLNLDGYFLVRHDRDATLTSKRIGGGLCMFIKYWSDNSDSGVCVGSRFQT